ncbi:hypothetical protein MMC17_003299 [Xylographa soralifera]|nr:hypothetical protein [Xylographa soralifera]
MREEPSYGEDLLWYFAYGSNMSSAKFTGSRGIVPRAAARVRVPGWVLALNIPGLPYSEPTFTSVVPRPPSTMVSAVPTDSVCAAPETGIPDVLGVAYLITADQYVRVFGSEGGGIAYEDIEVDAVPVGEKDREQTGERLKVRTLGAAIERYPSPRPSRRYMDIVTSGALEAQMPAEYQRYLRSISTYEPPSSWRGKMGAALFLSVWNPVMGLMEKITNMTLRRDGYAPPLVIWVSRRTMFLIWFTHDIIFAPLCGRGDGHREAEDVSIHDTEKSALLARDEESTLYVL